MQNAPGTQRIESRDFDIGSLFQEFYAVPDFQREYVWDTENVERLLQDIFDEYADDSGQQEYFIGSTVVCRSSGGHFQLIDGQQRMTTCFLTLCGFRDRFLVLGKPSDYLKQRIADVAWDHRTNSEKHRPRLELQYMDAHDVLDQIARGTLSDDVRQKPPTASVRNIVNAYDSIRDFLVANFKEDPEELSRFFSYFMSRVKLIRIETPELSRALKVFETINDRGVGLNAMDLLKNLMFIRADEAQHQQLRDKWRAIVDALDQCGEKPLRFLRYYILSRYGDRVDASKGIREDEIYKWFSDNEKVCGIDTAPIQFVDELLAAANAYALFVDGRDHEGRQNHFLGNISAMSNKATLHFILLLSARHLDEECFVELTRQIENLYFCFLLVREQSKTFERSFSRWAKEIAKIQDRQGLDAFVSQTIKPELASRSRRFVFAFDDLGEGRVQKYRLRYILAKLAQHVDLEAWGNAAYSDLSGYLREEIEHILPQTPTPEVRAQFDRSPEYDDYVPKLGNLVLLEKSLNASISNGDYDSKKSAYGKSKMLLTRSVLERPQFGQNTKADRIVAKLDSFDRWDSNAIEKRQGILRKLAHEVWSVPEPSGQAAATDDAA
jgi:hypothetical protein